MDLVLQAHEHSYERLWPQYKGVVLSRNYDNPQAPVQLISGAAGSKHFIDKMADKVGMYLFPTIFKIIMYIFMSCSAMLLSFSIFEFAKDSCSQKWC